MEVHYDEGLAIHIGPKPCVGAREGVDEASAGECIGQPLSRERMFFREPTLSTERKATRWGAISRAPGRLGVVTDPGMCRSFLFWEPGALLVGQMLIEQPGPQREGEEP